MILLDEVIGSDDDRLCTAVTIRADSMFSTPKGVPAHVVIEYMAQSCGAFVGLEARRAGQPPRIGLLLGTRDFQATRFWIRIGTKLRVQAVLDFREDTMAVFDCRADDDTSLVARAKLTVHQPNDLASFGGAVG